MNDFTGPCAVSKAYRTGRFNLNLQSILRERDLENPTKSTCTKADITVIKISLCSRAHYGKLVKV